MKAEYILDFRGSITPIMLLKMTQMFSEMETEDILERGVIRIRKRTFLKCCPMPLMNLYRWTYRKKMDRNASTASG